MGGSFVCLDSCHNSTIGKLANDKGIINRS